jgi:hypothetical protein
MLYSTSVTLITFRETASMEDLTDYLKRPDAEHPWRT